MTFAEAAVMIGLLTPIVCASIVVLSNPSIFDKMFTALASMLVRVWESIMILAGQRKVIEPPHHLDADPFEAKRMAIRNEHRWWGELFKQLAGHAWDYTPPVVEEIWDEDVDDLLTDEEHKYLRKTFLTKKCKHDVNEACYYCV